MKQTKLSEGHTTKFKFSPNLEPFYSRLLNQNIDLANTKTKVNSKSKFVLGNVNHEKSLKLRVLDITNLNKKINILSSIDRFNIGDIRSTNSNVEDKAVLSGEVLNQSIPAFVCAKPCFPKGKKQGTLCIQSILTQNRIKESKISKYLQTISNFEPEIAQFQNIVYNFNNNKKKFKLNSILEN